MDNRLPGPFLVGLFIVTASCANIETKLPIQSDILHLEGAELKAAQFETGQPRIGEGLAQSVQHPDITLQLMRENLELLQRLPSKKIQGHRIDGRYRMRGNRVHAVVSTQDGGTDRLAD